VAANVERWKLEQSSWFDVGKIPDNMLPDDVFETVGGAHRRRSNVSLREIIGFDEIERHNNNDTAQVHPE